MSIETPKVIPVPTGYFVGRRGTTVHKPVVAMVYDQVHGYLAAYIDADGKLSTLRKLGEGAYVRSAA